MSNTIQKPDIKVAVGVPPEVRSQPATTEKTATAQEAKSVTTNPMAVVETKNRVGKELETNYRQLEAAVEEIRKMADENLMNLGFSIDRKINTHVVVVTDKNSGQVIRQIPDEVVIRVAHNIADLKGLLFDKKM